MIVPVYQPIASSSHQIAKNFSSFNNYGQLGENERATHTGTLDPMAEGVLVVLTGEDRFQKNSYSKWKKTYEWSILWGIQTDSDDRLGLLTNHMQHIFPEQINDQILKQKIRTFLGIQKQKIHPFSARRIDGKSAFDFAKNGEYREPKFRQIEIFDFSFLKTEPIFLKNELPHWIEIIAQIDGDFRQEEIIKQWKKNNDNPELASQPLYQSHFKTICSSGTYIRQLARDLADSLKIQGVVTQIRRTQNGEYKINDCINIKTTL